MLPFGIGFSEVLLIVVVLLLVVGPQKLPEIARTLGKGVRAARRAGQELRDAVQIDEIRRNVYDHTVRPWQQAHADIEDAVVESGRKKPAAPVSAAASAAAAASATVAAASAAAVPPDAEAADPEAPDPHDAFHDELHDPDEAAPSGPIGRGPGPIAPAELPARSRTDEPETADASHPPRPA